MPPLPYILALTLTLLTTAFLRLLYVLPSLNHHARSQPRPRGTPTHLLIVLGSGGHTAEMLSLLPNLSTSSYTHRSYVISSGDDFSALKAAEFERSLSIKQSEEAEAEPRAGAAAGAEHTKEGNGEADGYTVHTVPRARRIHQSLLNTPLTCLHCLHACLKLLLFHPKGYPDLILTNGPATSLILILAATILRYFAFLPYLSSRSRSRRKAQYSENVGKMRVIYIESWARVKRPSLSGRIIVWCGLCDRVLVQWKGLENRGWGEYRGILVR